MLRGACLACPRRPVQEAAGTGEPVEGLSMTKNRNFSPRKVYLVWGHTGTTLSQAQPVNREHVVDYEERLVTTPHV